jgi:hypothetical protein
VTVLTEGQEVDTGLLESAMWNRELWEASIRELANGGKCVVR